MTILIHIPLAGNDAYQIVQHMVLDILIHIPLAGNDGILAPISLTEL